jgi:hypothetical protein
MGEDTARCTVAINASDERFWKGTLADGFYNCDGTPKPLETPVKDICEMENTWVTDTVFIETAEFNSWTIPVGLEDTDVNDLTKRWCDAANVKGQLKVPYQCKSIKCHMERKLQTGDELQDYYFSPTSKTSCDTLKIRPGRARIYFKNGTYPKGFSNTRENKYAVDSTVVTTLSTINHKSITEIPICAGASTLVLSGLALASAFLI